MRLSNTQAVARPNFIDRNPVEQVISFSNSGIAPHALTVRASYTVPAGRKFQVGGGFFQATRDVVAGSPLTMAAYMRYTKNGGSAIFIYTTRVLTNAVGDSRQANMPAGFQALAGDLFELVTSDTSTTGSGSYDESLLGTEADA